MAACSLSGSPMPTHRFFAALRAALCAGLLFGSMGVAWAQQVAKPMPGEFVVIDGRADRGTYAGWKLFHAHCDGCHGVGGVGSSVAPNLVDRIGNYTPRGFATKVLTSYRIVPMSPDGTPPATDAERDALLEEVMKRERTDRGQPLMPAWDDDAEVAPHVLDIYAYLNARAAGVLGPGKPKLLPAPR
jgi:mono/diheme cytochrome c family protein